MICCTQWRQSGHPTPNRAQSGRGNRVIGRELQSGRHPRAEVIGQSGRVGNRVSLPIGWSLFNFFIKTQRTSFFPKKKRLRQCITHTQGIEITGTPFFLKKKRLRQCITHTQGIQIPGTSFFPKKKRLRQCITHTQGIKIPGIP